MSNTAKNIVALAGGVGGAKLAYGLAQIAPPDKLTIVVNTADDFDHLGLHRFGHGGYPPFSIALRLFYTRSSSRSHTAARHRFI